MLLYYEILKDIEGIFCYFTKSLFSFQVCTAARKTTENDTWKSWTGKADAPFHSLRTPGNNSALIQLLRGFQQALGWVTEVTRRLVPRASPWVCHLNKSSAPACHLPPPHPTHTHPSVTASKPDAKAELQEHETVLSNFKREVKPSLSLVKTGGIINQKFPQRRAL